MLERWDSHDRQYPGIPDGVDNDFVRTEAGEIRRGLLVMQQSGHYGGLRFGQNAIVSGAGGLRFIRDTFEYRRIRDAVETEPVFSASYVTGFSGQFIKVRFSCWMRNAESGAAVADRLILELSRRMMESRRTIDPAAAALRAIEAFRQNPLGENAADAMRRIIGFGEDSDDVLVSIDSRLLSWDFGSALNRVLLVAYIAGNMEAQLRDGQKKDRPYEGALQVIATYRQLREMTELEPIAVIERWIGMQADGSLKTFVEEQAAAR